MGVLTQDMRDIWQARVPKGCVHIVSSGEQQLRRKPASNCETTCATKLHAPKLLDAETR
jgi:hypothetical protein